MRACDYKIVDFYEHAHECYPRFSALTVTVLTAVLFTHKVVYTSFSRTRVANPKRAPLLCTWFSFALRGDTKVVLELNTGTFGTSRRALQLIRGTLG